MRRCCFRNGVPSDPRCLRPRWWIHRRSVDLPVAPSLCVRIRCLEQVEQGPSLPYAVRLFDRHGTFAEGLQSRECLCVDCEWLGCSIAGVCCQAFQGSCGEAIRDQHVDFICFSDALACAHEYAKVRLPFCEARVV